MDVHELIREEITKVQLKLQRAGLDAFPISFELVDGLDKAKVIARAYSVGLKIKFNNNYFRFPEDIPFAQLVAHEVSHLYQFKYFPHATQGHGREFRKIMKFLGFSGNAKVAVGGEAKAYNATVAVPRKTKTKTRHVYLTQHSKREVWLTVQQHNKQQAWAAVHGVSRFAKDGEPLVATGKVKKFK